MSGDNSVSQEETSKVTKNDEPKSESESESKPGLVLDSGEINWDCPCLDGMASGPCGSEFKESFSCMYNTKDGQDNLHCLQSFKNFFDCISQYPDYYREKGFSDDLLDINEDSKASKEDPDNKTDPKK